MGKKLYKKTRRVKWTLGKFDWGSGRRENLVEVEFGFRYIANNEAYFCASGMVWNRIRTEAIEGCQCLDTIKDRCASKLNQQWKCLLLSIVSFWDNNQLKYHSKFTKKELQHLERMMDECVKLGGVLIEKGDDR